MIESPKNNAAISFVCITTIITTLFTQLPAYSSFFRPIMYAMWIFTLIVSIVRNHLTLPVNGFIILYLFTILVLGAECLFLYNTHSKSYALHVIPLPFLCYIVGYFIAQSLDEEVTYKVLSWFFLVSLFLFLFIFFTYIGGFGTWYEADYYIYSQKNSAAQIMGCTIILTFFLVTPPKHLMNIGKYVALTFLFLIIVAMQCRTAMISLIIVGLVYYFVELPFRMKVLVGFVILLSAVVVIQSHTLTGYVTKAFVFTERQTKNLDNFTSGRLTSFANAWKLFMDNKYFGTGHYRVDDFYLCILSDVGLIGFVPVMILWLFRIGKNITAYVRNRTPFTSCVMCLTVFYFSESIFEAYPPFGPGVCSFMFWVTCAFLDAKLDADIENEDNRLTQEIKTRKTRSSLYLRD